MTQGNEARVLSYTQKLANCLKHQKTTDYKHLKFVLKPLLRRTNDDIDNVHSVSIGFKSSDPFSNINILSTLDSHLCQ